METNNYKNTEARIANCLGIQGTLSGETVCLLDTLEGRVVHWKVVLLKEGGSRVGIKGKNLHTVESTLVILGSLSAQNQWQSLKFSLFQQDNFLSVKFLHYMSPIFIQWTRKGQGFLGGERIRGKAWRHRRVGQLVRFRSVG